MEISGYVKRGKTMLGRLVLACVLAAAGAVLELFPAALQAPYEVVNSWPQIPKGFEFGQVTGIGIDSKNHVWVLHRGDRPIMCFDGVSGKLLSFWGYDQIGKGHGLAVDSKDNVWITDLDHHQVFKFSNVGDLLMAVGTEDESGVDQDHFNQPTDVAVSPNGEFFVCDGYGNNRVLKFAADGSVLLQWGTKGSNPGQFETPHGIALDGQGRVYVADRSNARVQVFDRNGLFLHEWKSDALGRPWCLAVGLDGFLYTVDGGEVQGRGHVLKLDLEGKIIEKWGSFGSQDTQWAHDIAIAPNGDLYVSEGTRVEKFVHK
jgi:peptidylamidoglycolate lyase